jgi:hypothetical protein
MSCLLNTFRSRSPMFSCQTPTSPCRTLLQRGDPGFHPSSSMRCPRLIECVYAWAGEQPFKQDHVDRNKRRIFRALLHVLVLTSVRCWTTFDFFCRRRPTISGTVECAVALYVFAIRLDWRTPGVHWCWSAPWAIAMSCSLTSNYTQNPSR